MPPEQNTLPGALRQQDTTQQRQLTIETRAIDAEARTFELALSSEYPVERYFGMEVLDHSPESVDLSRLQNGAAVLVNHNFDDHVGVVESVRIDADRRVRVQVRLGKSARATDIFNDVQDEILRHVSVGYQIHKAVLDEERDDGPDTYRITRWTPYEVSLVTVPADPTVGIGRSAAPGKSAGPAPEPKTDPQPEQATEERTMPPEKQKGTTEPQTVDTATIERQAREGEINRAKQIRAIGRQLKLDEDMTERAIHDGASVDQFRQDAIDKLEERAQAQQGAPVTELGLSRKESQQFSLMRAIEACVSKNWKGAEFERECSLEIADRLDREARGFFVPAEVQNRTMSTGVAADGGNLVATNLMDGQFIENLKADSVLGQLGAQFITGLVGDVDFGRLDAGATFGWIAEGADGTEADAQIGLVSLTPKTITGQVPMTRRLRKQSSPAVEALLLRDMQRGAALGIDAAGLEGAVDGPTGIAATAGVLTQLVAGAGAPTWDEIVGFRTKVSLQNALRQNCAFVVNPTVAGNLMTNSKDSGSGRFIMEDDRAAGFQVIESTQVATNRTLFGNFADVMVGMWGVLDVLPDEAALAKSGGLVLRVFQDADVGVRHPQSFCIDSAV